MRVLLIAFSLLALSSMSSCAQQPDLISQPRAEIERMQDAVAGQQATIDSLLASPSSDPELGVRVDSLQSVLLTQRAQYALLVDSLESVVADLREANDGLPGEPQDTTVGDVGDPPAPGQWPDNEPEGMTSLTHVTGESLDWSGWSKFGGDRWNDPTRVVIVADSRSKFGHAIEKRFKVGDVSGWGDPERGAFRGVGQTYPHREFREVYVRYVFRYSPNWDHQDAGEKLWLGNSPYPSTSAYVRCDVFYLGGHIVGAPFTMRQWFPIRDDYSGPRLNPCQGKETAYVKAARDEYHTIEVLKRANDPGVANGSLRLWIDGVEYTRFYGHDASRDDVWFDVPLTGVRWVDSNGVEPGVITTRIEAPLYWGGQNDVKRVDDWIRISEIYVSGRNP